MFFPPTIVLELLESNQLKELFLLRKSKTFIKKKYHYYFTHQPFSTIFQLMKLYQLK
jgi:hypothetical protein